MASGVQLRIDAALTTFRFEQAGLLATLYSQEGMIARDLARRAIRVTNAAKQNASGRPGPNVQTGLLRGSITWRLGGFGPAMYADIGSAVYYAPFVEQGTSKMPAYPFLRPALGAARL